MSGFLNLTNTDEKHTCSSHQQVGAGSPRGANNTNNQTPASSQEISLLTSAIQLLTKSLPGPLNSTLVEEKRHEKGKGKRPASSAANATPAKKSRTKDGKESEAKNSMSASTDSNERQDLYDSVLNSKDDESEHESTRSCDEDEFILEVVKEYESDDTVGDGLKSEQLAKLVNKMFRCKLSEKKSQRSP